MTRAPDSGITLIEALVALAVLAITAITLLGATEAHVARTFGLETRAAAGWAAENHLAELSLGLQPPPDPAPLLNVKVHLTTQARATTDPDLTRLDITASVGNSKDKTSGPVARLTGFVFTPAPSGEAP